MFAEMAEFTFSARIRSSEHVSCRDGRNLYFQRVPALVFLHSHGCRDGGICVFSADPQCLLILMVAEMAEFSISARARNLRFQCESAFCVRILMVAETAEFALLARICALFCIRMVAEMPESAFSARIRNVFVHSDGCRNDGILVFSADPRFCWHSDGCRDVRICVSSLGTQCFLHSDGCRDGGFAFSALIRVFLAF